MEDEFLMLDDQELEPAAGWQVHSSSQAVASGLVADHIRGEWDSGIAGEATESAAVGRASGKVR